MSESMIGKKFGEWTIIDDAPDRIDATGKHHKRYLCECSCGNKLIKDFYKLKSGQKMCRECYLKVLPNNGIKFENKYNRYDLSGEYGVGWTLNTNKEFYFDLEDYDKIKDYCWYEAERHYVRHTINDKKNSYISIHQVILCDGCDHIDRNPLNNRKSNLRPCTQKENTRNRSIPSNNTSGFIGVSFNKRNNKWFSYIKCDGILHRLGYYIDKDEAIKARLKAEKEYFGDFAPQKHLFETYSI